MRRVTVHWLVTKPTIEYIRDISLLKIKRYGPIIVSGQKKTLQINVNANKTNTYVKTIGNYKLNLPLIAENRRSRVQLKLTFFVYNYLYCTIGLLAFIVKTSVWTFLNFLKNLSSHLQMTPGNGRTAPRTTCFVYLGSCVTISDCSDRRNSQTWKV